MNSRAKLVGKMTLVAVASFFLSVPMANVVHAEATTTPFLVDLKLGSNGSDVTRLQQYLNTHNFPVAVTGIGSAGQETTYFGQKTRTALMSFQQHFANDILIPLGLTKATGNFFSGTRNFINKTAVTVATSTPAVTYVTHGGGGSRAATYTVTASGDGNVSISSNNSQAVRSGATSSFTVTALTGHTRSNTVGGTCPSGSWVGSTYTTGAITGACSVSFSASINSYRVTPSTDGFSTVSPLTRQTVEYGSTKSFTVTPQDGYVHGSVGGTCPSGSWVGSTYTTGAITGACSVKFTSTFAGGVGGAGGGGGATMVIASGNLYVRQVDGTGEYSDDNASWNVFSWPLGITNDSPETGTLHVKLVGDFNLTSASEYFGPASDNISFEGGNDTTGRPTVLTVSATNYPGLLRNGSAITAGNNYIRALNIFVDGSAGSLASGGGWIAQEYFSSGAVGNEISDSGSNGTVSTYGGGIAGRYNDGLRVSRSFSLGNIGQYGGGIVGVNSANITVTDSYSTGSIASYAGGIIGATATDSTVTNSYSSGLIGSSGGGIFGLSTDASSVANSYTTGTISTDAGGIFGETSSNVTANNVYTVGTNNGGVYFGSTFTGVTVSNAYAEEGAGWHDINAQSVLTNIATLWTSIGVNTNYRLRGVNAPLYAQLSQTIAKGGTTSAVQSNFDTCSIVSINDGSASTYPGITINASTGVISTTSGVESDTYNIIVTCDTQQGGYATTDLELTVN